MCHDPNPNLTLTLPLNLNLTRIGSAPLPSTATCRLCGQGGKGLIRAPATLSSVSPYAGYWEGATEVLRPSGYGLTLPSQLVEIQAVESGRLLDQMKANEG